MKVSKKKIIISTTISIIVVLLMVVIAISNKNTILNKTFGDFIKAQESSFTIEREIIKKDDNYTYGIIRVEDKQNGIKEIITPDGLTIAGNNRSRIAIDYKLEQGKDYIFTATNGIGETKTVTINSNINIKVSNIELNKTSGKATLTNSLELQVVKIEPENADTKAVIWTSSNTNIATVSDTGIVTPKAIGTVVITCASVDGGATVTCTVEVVDGTLIYTREDLEKIPSGTANKGKTYILMNDIDLAGKNWTPIGEFNGTFDGNGHIIKNMTVSTYNAGFISNFNYGAKVENVYFENADVRGLGNSNHGAGVIAAISMGDTQIINCKVTGLVSHEGWYAGGLVGIRWSALSGPDVVRDSFAVVKIAEVGTGGAIFGQIGGAVSIENSYGVRIKGATTSGWKYVNSKAEQLSEEQFADASNFEGWDFENTWVIKDGYPELRMFLRD